jgi:hypothetical protein
MPHYASPEEVLHALKSVDYPATKDQLLRAAQAAGASEEVIRALRAIPPVEYTGREELARSVPTDPAEDRNLSPAQRAEAARLARLRAKTHLSQYMLDVPKPPIEDELDR